MAAKIGRWLAPLALLAVAAGIYLIVHSALVTSPRHVASPGPTFTTRRAGPHAGARGPRFYTVRSGDTLSAIAQRTRVPLSELESLNPSLSPNSLQTGQRLRLRR